MSFNGKEGKPGAGVKPPKIFEITSFESKENALFDIRRGHSKKDTFAPLLKRAGVQTPRIPIVASLSVQLNQIQTAAKQAKF